MFKLRDIRVNVIPSLDVRQAQVAANKMSSIFSMAAKATSKSIPIFGVAMQTFEKGIEFLEKANIILEQPVAVMRETLEIGSRFKEVAAQMGGSTTDLLHLLDTLAFRGAKQTSVLDLADRFSMRANENNIQGNLYQQLIQVLTKINNEKDETKRRNMIGNYFGMDASANVNSVLPAVMQWGILRNTIPRNPEKAEALEKSWHTRGRVNDISWYEGMNRVNYASASGGQMDSLPSIARQEEQAKTNVLQSTSAQTMTDIRVTASKISNNTDIMSQKMIDMSASLLRLLGIFEKMNAGIDLLNNTAKKVNVSGDKSK